MLPSPPSAAPQWAALIAALGAYEEERPSVAIRGWRRDGTTLHLRFVASRVTPFVQVHVQSTGASGGGANYNATTYISSTETDCQEDRQQDVAITLNGVDRYTVWLIPITRDYAGNAIKHDGQGVTNDRSAFIDLGV